MHMHVTWNNSLQASVKKELSGHFLLIVATKAMLVQMSWNFNILCTTKSPGKDKSNIII